MPELPEVQTIVNDLNNAGLAGRTVTAARVFWPRSIAVPWSNVAFPYPATTLLFDALGGSSQAPDRPTWCSSWTSVISSSSAVTSGPTDMNIAGSSGRSHTKLLDCLRTIG